MAKKDCKIVVMVARADLDVWTQRARELDIPLAQYVRTAVRNGGNAITQEMVVWQKLIPRLTAILAELGSICELVCGDVAEAGDMAPPSTVYVYSEDRCGTCTRCSTDNCDVCEYSVENAPMFAQLDS